MEIFGHGIKVIAKMHVGDDAMTKTERFEMYTDDTSKVGKKIVGHQVTTAVCGGGVCVCVCVCVRACV